MKKQRRLDAILNYLQAHPVVSVQELGEEFKVSEVTMRRDLTELQELNIVKRMHGSVMLLPENKLLIPSFKQKALENVQEKQAIAAMAVTLLPENSVIFVNGGTTTLEFIARIVDRNVTIITNNAMAINHVAAAKARLIITGGEYNPESCTFSGELSLSTIATVNADMCFLGANGLSEEGGFSTYFSTESNINDQMMRKCRGPVVVLADHSKIGRTCHYTNENLDRITYLITDDKADRTELMKIKRRRPLNIIQVKP